LKDITIEERHDSVIREGFDLASMYRTVNERDLQPEIYAFNPHLDNFRNLLDIVALIILDQFG
jgi:hypothetical protein